MEFIRLTTVEIRRLARTRLTWLLFMSTVGIAAVGIFAPITGTLRNASTAVLLGPAQMGAIIGSLLFAFFAISESDWVSRHGAGAMTETIVDAATLNVARTTSVLIVSVAAALTASLIYLPYSAHRLGGLFDLRLYLFSYWMVMLPAMVFSILIASGLYLMTRRMDLSFLIYGVLFLASVSLPNNYLVAWIQTALPGYSNCFGNSLPVATVFWNRLLWLCLSAAVFIAGIAATRRHGLGMARSVFASLRRVLLLALAAACFVAGALAYSHEPYFVSAAKPEFRTVIDPKTGTVMSVLVSADDRVDGIRLLRVDGDVDIDARSGSLDGRAVYLMDNVTEAPLDIRLSLQSGYSLESLSVDGHPLPWQDLPASGPGSAKCVQVSIPTGRGLALEVAYGGRPKLDSQRQSSLSGDVIGSKYVYLGSVAVLPTLNVDRSGCQTVADVTLPANLTLIATGGRTTKSASDPATGTATWRLSLNDQLPLNLIAGEYACLDLAAGGTTVQFFYNRKCEQAIRDVDAERVISEAIEFFTDSYGPLGYRDAPLKIVQNSAFMTGGAAIGNICSVGEDAFTSDRFADNRLEGTNGVEVLVHEIAHQWWGIGTLIPSDDMPWTPEGLTVYSTYKFLQHKYGAEYAKATCADEWQFNWDLMKRAFYYRHPELLTVLPLNYQFTVVGPQNSVVMYSRMPLQLLKAEQLLGEDKLRAALSALYQRHNAITYDAFLKECGLAREAISVE